MFLDNFWQFCTIGYGKLITIVLGYNP